MSILSASVLFLPASFVHRMGLQYRCFFRRIKERTMIKKLATTLLLVPGIVLTTLTFPAAADPGLNLCTDHKGRCAAQSVTDCKPGDWNCTPYLSCDCDLDVSGAFCMCWQYGEI